MKGFILYKVKILTKLRNILRPWKSNIFFYFTHNSSMSFCKNLCFSHVSEEHLPSSAIKKTKEGKLTQQVHKFKCQYMLHNVMGTIFCFRHFFHFHRNALTVLAINSFFSSFLPLLLHVAIFLIHAWKKTGPVAVCTTELLNKQINKQIKIASIIPIKIISVLSWLA